MISLLIICGSLAALFTLAQLLSYLDDRVRSIIPGMVSQRSDLPRRLRASKTLSRMRDADVDIDADKLPVARIVVRNCAARSRD